MGDPRQEPRWIVGEKRSYRSGDRVGEVILVDPVPYIEDELAAGTKHPPRFRECPGFVGEEHDPELADDGVECRALERQFRGIRLTPFHRTPTLQDGTPFVIQGGDPTGTGTGGPGYTIKDEPVTTEYKRGSVAMARTSAPDSVGSQFFIVLDDDAGPILASANTYQIIGNVSSGMETADAIYEASAGVELPASPVVITTATVTNP